MVFGEEADGTVPPLMAFGDYVLLEELGRGAMGVVYQARQKSLNRTVAVKMLLAGEYAPPDARKRFQLEAEAAARLKHPGLVAIYEVGEDDGVPFFSMEFVDGPTLSAAVRKKPMEPLAAARLLRDVALAVQHAHEEGIVHRDLKPGNIMLDASSRPRVTDFGLARRIGEDSTLTRTGQILGTPSFMAPEALDGSDGSGVAGDIYSLGAILYDLLAHRPPFVGATIEAVLVALRTVDPVPPRRLSPAVPRDLETVCLKCLEKDPRRRYASAAELADELGRVLEGLPIAARPLSGAARAWRWCRRHPAVALLTACLVLAVVGGFAGVLTQWRRASTARDAMERERYFADIQAASLLVDQGDITAALRVLDSWLPATGKNDQRGFEWFFVRARCRPDTLYAGDVPLEWTCTSLAWSPDGKLVISGDQEGAPRLWDATNGHLLGELAGASRAWSVGFFDSDTAWATDNGAREVRFFDTRTRKLIPGRAMPGLQATLSPTKRWWATQPHHPFDDFKRGGPVRVFDGATGAEIATVHPDGWRPAFSPNEKFLAVAGSSRDVHLYNTKTWQPAGGPLITDNWVRSLAFSPDSTQLAATDWSGQVYVWDLQQREWAARRFFGPEHALWDVLFSPDGDSLIAAGSDRTIWFWNVRTGAPRGRLHGHEDEVWALALSPDGMKLVSGGKDRKVLFFHAAPQTSSPQQFVPQETHATPHFSSDGRIFAATRNNAPGNVLYDLPAWQPRSVRFEHHTALRGFAPDGAVLQLSPAAPALLWLDSASGRELATLPLPFPESAYTSGSGYQRNAACLSPGGRYFAAISGGAPSTSVVVDVPGRKILTSFSTLPVDVCAPALSADGHWMAVAQGQRVRLHDLLTGKARDLPTTGHDASKSLVFSADGTLLATGGEDGFVNLYQTSDGSLSGMFKGHPESINALAMVPGRPGEILCLGGGELRLWRTDTRRLLSRRPVPHAVDDLVISADGRFIVINLEGDKAEVIELGE